MTHDEFSAELGVDEEAVSANAAAFLRRAVATAIFIVFGSGCFVIGSLLDQSANSQHAYDALVKADNAQRQANGDQAMIFAVCRAFHRRDLNSENRWNTVTAIEEKYKRVTTNPTDVAYHEARRKALVKLAAADERIVKFDCIRGMERAYFEGARSSKPPIDANMASPQPTMTPTTTPIDP